ncbi:hypothetical protein [Pseudoxanthomonas winnipegensis]|uniref:hypothetical protein n=1 Tax=Pseudoxanthomonas winnipegensis TaxID=2480810 RepID=UPI00102E0CA3|nr:hypothetical protein [Pseudoxanthomonas winnipegensis]RZZ85664.1 hypothetical protein EA663_11680 [Pseudoxanthomonas winnipegensis]
MEEFEKPSQEAITAAQQLLTLAAVRALMESHPNPEAFRESWAHCLSLTTRDAMSSPEPFLSDLNAAFQTLLPVWQSYFPDSAAAKTKPKPGERPDDE